MSSRHYEELWQEWVTELVAALDVEHPEDHAAAPKALGDWARLYLRYAGMYRKLCAAHDGLVQPQKRRAARRALEACLGRLLELRAWLAALQGGCDVLDVLGEELVGAGLTPNALELPVPAYFREERAAALAARAQAAAAAAAASGASSGDAGDGAGAAEAQPAAGGDSGGEAKTSVAAAQVAAATEAAQGAAEAGAEAAGKPAAEPGCGAGEGGQTEAEHACPQPQPEPQGQQVQEEGQLAKAAGEPGVGEEERARRAAAAVALQAGARGWLARRRVAAARRAEMEFLGMLPPSDGGRSAALQAKLTAIAVDRKQRQVARAAELEGALPALKVAVRQREGWRVKEGVRDKLHAWFLGSRHPETGDYADLPEAAKGGSRDIVHPPPPAPSAEEAAAAAKAGAKAAASSGKPAAAAKPGAGKGGGGGGAAPQASTAFLQGLREAVQEYLDVWQGHEPADPTLALLPPELQGLPQPRGGSGWEAYDASMAAEEVRAVAYEELRLEADDEMRGLIAEIKGLLRAEREGRKKKGAGKKGGKEGKGKAGAGGASGGGKEKKGAAAAGGKESGKGGKAGAAGEGAAPAKKKRPKDLTAGRSIESIFAELAAAGLVRAPPPTTADAFIGGDRLARPTADDAAAAAAAGAAAKPKTGGKKANAAPKPAADASAPGSKGGKGGKAGAAAAGGEGVGDAAAGAGYPEPSLAQARQAVVASCILPLGAHEALAAELAPPTTVLLYGPPGSGKALLAGAVAHQSGATQFDLSPATTAGQYAGKAAANMVHMVFKAARALAPSVVLLRDVDQVFVSDKTRAKALAAGLPGGEPPNRIKKQLLAEVAGLAPGDGVLVLCTSSQPHTCVKKDERALRSFVQRYIQLPLPDHGGRAALLAAFAQREGLDLQQPSLTLLAQLTGGLSAGQLQAFTGQLAARMRGDGQEAGSGGSTGTDTAGAEPLPSSGARPPAAGAKRRTKAPAMLDVALEVLPAFAPLPADEAAALREWTARVHEPLPPEEEVAEGGKKGAGKKK